MTFAKYIPHPTLYLAGCNVTLLSLIALKAVAALVKNSCMTGLNLSGDLLYTILTLLVL